MIFFPSQTYLLKSIRSLREHLSRKHKIWLVYVSVLLFTTAVFDVFGLAFILPVLAAATNEEAIFKDKILYSLYQYFEFENPDYFLLFLISALLVIFLLKNAWGLFVSYLQTRMVASMALFISRDQFYKYLAMPYALFQKIPSSTIVRDIVSNPLSYAQWVVLSLITVFTETVIVALIIIGIAIYNWKLFLFTSLIILPASALVSRFVRKKTEDTGIGIDRYYPLSMGSATEAIYGYTDIKLMGKEDFYVDRFSDINKLYIWYVLKQTFMNYIPFRTNEVIALLGMIIILLYGLFLAENRSEIVTLIGLFAAASYRLMPSLNRIVNSMNFIQVNQVSIDNLNKHIEYFHEANRRITQKSELTFNRSIECREITFYFPDSEKPVLDRLSFSVKKGETVGFIGKSGSGKTTLMNVLLGFYTPRSGQLLIDGVEINENNLASWRARIGYVKQDIFLLEGTIEENIALGEENPDPQRLQDCIRQASLSDWIDSLPDGINTLIGERGSNLSGGQKQRIGIARSLYRHADMLIFDEATSALDIHTEQEVTQAIEHLSHLGKTIFIIAHRITTLKNCDRIYELDNGTIAGIYSYKQLIEKIF
jgi:ABC-type multidrug transport system fused ATPase/permease subunit